MTLADLIRDRKSGRVDCPARKHNSRRTVAVRVLDDGTTVVFDHAGCPTTEILRAEGLDWPDLFPSREPAERRERALRQRQANDLEAWRDQKLTKCCTILRNLDALIRTASEALSFADTDGMDTTTAWDALEFAHTTRRALEQDFDRLNSKDRNQHAEVMREYEGAQ